MSEWQLTLLKPALTYLKRLDQVERRRILDALALLEENPFQPGIKPLTGRPEWRYRIGDYRVLLVLERDRKRIFVTRIGARGDVYK